MKDSTMNRRIKDARKKLLLTQKEIGDVLEFTDNYIYMMESGKKPVSERYIHGLCTAYGVNEEWLRTGQGSMINESHSPSPLDASEHILNTESLRIDLIKLVCSLPSEKIQSVYDYASFMAHDDR